MRAVNRFKVDRFPDYVVLRLGMSHSTDRGDLGPDPIEVVVPITVSAAVGLSLFESVLDPSHNRSCEPRRQPEMGIADGFSLLDEGLRRQPVGGDHDMRATRIDGREHAVAPWFQTVAVQNQEPRAFYPRHVTRRRLVVMRLVAWGREVHDVGVATGDLLREEVQRIEACDDRQRRRSGRHPAATDGGDR